MRWGNFWYEKQFAEGEYFQVNHIHPIELDKAFGKVSQGTDSDVKVLPKIFRVIDDIIDLSNEIDLKVSSSEKSFKSEVKVRVKEEQCS